MLLRIYKHNYCYSRIDLKLILHAGANYVVNSRTYYNGY